MSNRDPVNPILDFQHHDRPERHYFGQSLGVPIAPPSAGLPSIASAGVSDTPAREDHIHTIALAGNPGIGGNILVDMSSPTAPKYIQGGSASLTSDSSSNVTFNYPVPFPTATVGLAIAVVSSTSIVNTGLQFFTVNRFGATIALRNSSTGASPGAGIGFGFRWLATGY